MNYTSENIDLLITALAKAQGEMSAASKDCKGYNYKYADLASVWGACRDALSHNGLAVTQIETQNESGEVLVTILGHSSGQWIRSIMAIRVKPSGKTNELQERGSVLTYLRRYALSAIVGVAPAEDDDGKGATGYQAKSEVTVEKKSPANKCIAPSQAAELRAIISKCSPEYKQYVTEYLSKNNLKLISDLPEVFFDAMNQASIAARDEYIAWMAEQKATEQMGNEAVS